MSLKHTQYDSKCYCNSAASTYCSIAHVNCCRRKSTGSGSVFSVASKCDKQSSNARIAAKNKQKTDFVKIKPKTTNRLNDGGKNRRGLGHSNLHCATNFSRRNSAATTVTFSTPCATPASIRSSNATTPTLKTTSPLPTKSSTISTILKNLPVTMSALSDNFSALSVSSKSDRSSDCDDALPHEYTEQRRYYESAKQLMKLISTHGDKYTALNLISGGGGGGGIGAAACVGDAEVDAERLRQLQEFRLQNAEDCFTVHRQLDLHLPMRAKTLMHGGAEQLVSKLQRQTMPALQGKAENSSAKVTLVKEDAKKTQYTHTSITPYAVRQRLLQLRLEAEELKRAKPERKLYGPLEKSCALRYQEAY